MLNLTEGTLKAPEKKHPPFHAIREEEYKNPLKNNGMETASYLAEISSYPAKAQEHHEDETSTGALRLPSYPAKAQEHHEDEESKENPWEIKSKVIGVSEPRAIDDYYQFGTIHDAAKETRKEKPVIEEKNLQRKNYILIPIQEWEGYITNKRWRKFEARLTDLTAGSTVETEIATIPIKVIPKKDRKNIQTGAFFWWVIGYKPESNGEKKRVSKFVFQELPAITEKDWEKARSWAKKIRKAFKVE